MATNNAKDNLLKQEYFEQYGIADGLRRLAEDYPFQPGRKQSSPARPATTTQTLIGARM